LPAGVSLFSHTPYWHHALTLFFSSKIATRRTSSEKKARNKKIFHVAARRWYPTEKTFAGCVWGHRYRQYI